jgi:anaerobic magnesium-protoporphyrin IX monomethyl ester cyclase
MDKDTEINLANSRIENSKDWAMTRVMADYARTKPQKNLTPIVLHNATRQTHLALAIAPAWGVFFPPYNIARLTAVARTAGYKTSVFDVNVKAYRHTLGNLDFNAWDTNREWMWTGRWYFKDLHPHVEPVLTDYVDRIVAAKPDIVGFSMYYTNEQATNWMAIQIRRQLPEVKIIVGGPQASEMNLISTKFYDHIVHGEGEQVLLDMLDKIEQQQPIGSKIVSRDMGSRMDLDSLPFPDYSDYDMADYIHVGGMSAEISRGCIAKCVFCTEVHFWKYRGRLSNNLLDEIEHQHNTYGLDFVWFIDSLVNGNLNELRAFCLGVVEKGLKIKWQGYARCDGRMDLEYYKDLRASGCIQLSYGIESGSQHVLDVMKKEINLDEIEQNLKDAASVGIEAHTNWIIGFPNEDTQAFADTLTLIWRIRDYKILTISDGLSLMLSPGAEITDNLEKFNIPVPEFLNAWTTADFKNTKVHRLIRQKTFNIFLENLNSKKRIFGFERPRLKETYSIEYDRANVQETISREVFDYSIIKTELGEFADSVMNEIWPVLRSLWRGVGPYSITIKFDPELDTREFGDRLGCNYTAEHKFSIDGQGNWTAEHSYKFQQDDPTWKDMSFEHVWAGSGSW